jgi:hypothetical protein
MMTLTVPSAANSFAWPPNTSNNTTIHSAWNPINVFGGGTTPSPIFPTTSTTGSFGSDGFGGFGDTSRSIPTPRASSISFSGVTPRFGSSPTVPSLNASGMDTSWNATMPGATSSPSFTHASAYSMGAPRQVSPYSSSEYAPASGTYEPYGSQGSEHLSSDHGDQGMECDTSYHSHGDMHEYEREYYSEYEREYERIHGRPSRNYGYSHSEYGRNDDYHHHPRHEEEYGSHDNHDYKDDYHREHPEYSSDEPYYGGPHSFAWETDDARAQGRNVSPSQVNRYSNDSANNDVIRDLVRNVSGLLLEKAQNESDSSSSTTSDYRRDQTEELEERIDMLEDENESLRRSEESSSSSETDPSVLERLEDLIEQVEDIAGTTEEEEEDSGSSSVERYTHGNSSSDVNEKLDAIQEELDSLRH